ncbi:unnamed protein product [Pedinophyceae sp. YPF-701]|nr:unnamed protein product [Pedinophyceae sp. YPF-701]
MQAVTQCKAAASMSSVSSSIRGAAVAQRVAPVRAARVAALTIKAEKLCLHNLSPSEGARRPKRRVARGYGGKGGGTAGRGTRGQKSRSGASIRAGFEGGQMPLYRRLPKLKGIAGGMSAGLPKFNVINLDSISDKFEDGEEVTLETIQEKRIMNLSGREATLPLKVLGRGELTKKVTVKAVAFSDAAKAAIEAAGGTVVELPPKEKWVRTK